MKTNKILLIDDEPSVVRASRRYLEAAGFQVCSAGTLTLGAAAFRVERPDAVVLDYKLPDGDALDLLPDLKADEQDIPVIVLTGHGSIDLAVRCMQMGAENFLTKPVELATLVTILQRCLDNRKTQRRDKAARRTKRPGQDIDPFFGASAEIRALAAEAKLALDGNTSVLIQGETGTGKGVLARWLHQQSPRFDEPFVDLNSAGLSRELLESEIFGHGKGAFTGAVRDKKGLLEVAHRGTFFLDEIGDMDLQLQPKFLTALEERRFRRVGEVAERHVDVRLIAATHRDLARLVEEGTFRPDLYYRINTLTLNMPPLRRRIADIEALSVNLIASLADEMGRPRPDLSRAATELLIGHNWPGNIRELRNVIERALLVCRGPEIEPSDLKFGPATGGGPNSAPRGGIEMSLEQVERLHIERVLEAEAGQIDRVTEVLGIPRSTLYQRIKTMGIDLAAYR